MTKFKVALPPETEARLIEKARGMGLHPCTLARAILCQHLGGCISKDDTKTYTFTTRHWRELEAYCGMRNYISVEAGIPIMLDQAAAQNKLSDKQKEEFERLFKKLENPLSFRETTALEGN